MDPTRRARFERDGFLVVPEALDAATCQTLRARADALVEAFEPSSLLSVFTTDEQARRSDAYFLGSGDRIRFFFEEHAIVDGALRHPKAGAINKIGHALHVHDPVFAPLQAHLELDRWARALGQARPRLVQSMYIFKQPGIGGEVRLHQDSTFLFTDPPSVLGFWIALEDATRDNGCLWAVPGGHRGPLRQRFVRTADERTEMHTLDPTPWPEADAQQPLEVPMGTMIVLHGALPHRSDLNRSPRSRHAYALHMVDDACRWAADNWIRPATPPA